MLFIYDKLRNGMISNGLIRQFYDVCTTKCLTELWSPKDLVLQEDSYKTTLAEKVSWFNPLEMEVYRKVHDWRWETA